MASIRPRKSAGCEASQPRAEKTVSSNASWSLVSLDKLSPSTEEFTGNRADSLVVFCISTSIKGGRHQRLSNNHIARTAPLRDRVHERFVWSDNDRFCAPRSPLQPLV
jgi:hypothetical protein